ncbi:MAG: nucleotidyltransferase family protein [Thermoleophilia bacterium]
MTDRVAALLPGPRRALFLRACLLDGEDARAAWAAWLAGADDPAAAFADRRHACVRLAPLLVGVANGPGSGRLGAAATASLVREELRWRTLASAAAEALETLRGAGLEPVLVGGAAAALTAYATPWQRHCHDVDLVVDGTARVAAARLLAAAGWHPDPGAPSLAHPSGSRVSLHASPLRAPGRTLAGLRDRGGTVELGGERVTVAAPEHLLLRACEGAFVRAGGSLAWAADAAVLARSLDEEGWARAVEDARRAGAAAPAAVALGFLAREVGLPLPAGPLAGLAAQVDGRAEADCLALVPRLAAPRRVARRVRRELTRVVGRRRA